MDSELLQSSALTQALIQYLGGTRQLSELEEWLVGNLQDILDSGDARTIDMANALDALLIEKSERLVDEEEIRRNVSEMLNKKGLPEVVNMSASGNSFVESHPLIVQPNVFLRVSHSFLPAEADI